MGHPGLPADMHFAMRPDLCSNLRCSTSSDLPDLPGASSDLPDLSGTSPNLPDLSGTSPNLPNLCTSTSPNLPIFVWLPMIAMSKVMAGHDLSCLVLRRYCDCQWAFFKLWRE